MSNATGTDRELAQGQPRGGNCLNVMEMDSWDRDMTLRRRARRRVEDPCGEQPAKRNVLQVPRGGVGDCAEHALRASGGQRRSEEEERHLVVSARIWLCIYWFDHQCVCVVYGLSRSCVLTDGAARVNLGTGCPILLKHGSSIRHCRILLTHPMTSPSDLRLIAQIELIAQKSEWLVCAMD